MTKEDKVSEQPQNKKLKDANQSREKALRSLLESQQGSNFLKRPPKEPIEYVKTKLRAGYAY